MGTIKKGILGGFSGKVGTVVGGSWKGISYMRSLLQSVKNPRTMGQVSQRSKFTLTMNLLKPMTAFLRTGWTLYAHRQSPFNAAMSYTLANAILGTYPDYSIDASKVLVSRGSLTPATNAGVTPAAGEINLSWDNNSGVGSAKQTDKALVAVLNPAKGEAITTTEGADRMTEKQIIPVPADWAGNEIQVYLGFISEDGKTDKSPSHRLAEFPSMVRANFTCNRLACCRVFRAEIETKTTILRYLTLTRKSR